MRSGRTGSWICSALAVAALTVAAEAGTVIYVDAAAPGGGDGASWVMAFNDLQDALAAAVPNDQIWVAAGVYTPTGSNGNRSVAFQPVSGVSVYGGFAGWEEALEERDWILNETILSGDLNGDDGPQFQNYEENSYHVIDARNANDTAVFDGFTVRGGNADGSGFEGKGAGLYASNAALAVYRCAFEGNRALSKGGAVRVFESEAATLIDCAFRNNVADIGGAMAIESTTTVTIDGGRFIDNQGLADAGAVFVYLYDSVELIDCDFLNNDGWLGGGAFISSGEHFSAINCAFAANTTEWIGGAVIEVSPDSLFINCAFSRNVAELGGGVHCAADQRFINCTFSNNVGSGITMEDEIRPVVTNCIFWGNTPEQIAEDPGHPGGDPIVTYSDIQGGWNGEGNINADPLFVQPGADDLRLGFGSPCVNAGDNDAVPPYITTDILGNDRFIDGIVDMGAYEGEYEVLPPAAVEYDLDQGEFTLLIPDGGEYDPLSAAGAMMVNETGPDDATAVITEYDQNLHPEGEGFSVLGINLQGETSLANGQSRIQVFVPFGASDLDGADPALLDVTYFDEEAETWALAVSHNTGDSPGHDGPIGDRIVVVDGGNWGFTPHVGDWGVFWDPDEQKGFVWANVDYQGDFAFGVPDCPVDCAQPPDGFVDSEDLSALLAAWSDGLGPFDVNNDGTVDVVDLLTVLASWGPCP